MGSLLSGVGAFVQAAAGLALPFAAPPAPAYPCTRVVAFLQMAVGGVLPLVAYLWEEGGAAVAHACKARADDEQAMRAGGRAGRRARAVHCTRRCSTAALRCFT